MIVTEQYKKIHIDDTCMEEIKPVIRLKVRSVAGNEGPEWK
jgi:hypothetical protein